MDQKRLSNIIVRDLLAAVGDVMLRWGFLESAMSQTLNGSPRTPSIFQRWLASADTDDETIAEIKDVAAIRHLLAHGLCEVHAQPGHDGDAEVLCRDPDGALVRIPLRQLHDAAQRLDLLRLKIAKSP